MFQSQTWKRAERELFILEQIEALTNGNNTYLTIELAKLHKLADSKTATLLLRAAGELLTYAKTLPEYPHELESADRIAFGRALHNKFLLNTY